MDALTFILPMAAIIAAIIITLLLRTRPTAAVADPTPPIADGNGFIREGIVRIGDEVAEYTLDRRTNTLLTRDALTRAGRAKLREAIAERDVPVEPEALFVGALSFPPPSRPLSTVLLPRPKRTVAELLGRTGADR